MSASSLTPPESGRRKRANNVRLDFSVPDCCLPQNASTGSKQRAIRLIVAISMAARAIFVPASGEMSFGDYMDEAYHEMICGSGPRHAIDPAIFAQVRQLLISIAAQKQREDKQKGKFLPGDNSLPPPAPMPAPCCSGQTITLILRRRGQQFIPA